MMQEDVYLNNHVRRILQPDFKICPICGFKGKFEDYGEKKIRLNSRCPNCESTERIRLIWVYLVEKGIVEHDNHIVHIMPEAAIRYKLKGNKKIFYELGGIQDFDSLLTEHEDCDYIIANNVLDRISNLQSSLVKIKKSLVKNGEAMINVNIVSDEKENLTSMPLLYGSSYKQMIEENGFELSKIDSYDLIGQTLSYIFGIGANDYVLIAKKRD